MTPKKMLDFVSIGYQFLQIYLDHGDNLRERDLDDVVQFLVAQMPPIANHVKSKNKVHMEAVEEPPNEHVPI